MRTLHAIDELAPQNVSVLVLTYNEETNIGRCLESVAWSDDVVVLDSLSGDRTVEIAQGFANVRIALRRFDDYSGQRNHGLREISYRNAWLLMLDADEVVTPALAQEMLALARRGANEAADVCLIRREIFLEQRRLKWNLSANFWIARMMRPHAVYYQGAVHERLCYPGKAARLNGALEHHQFDKGIDDWISRRTRYAAIEAEMRRCRADPSFRARDLFASDVLRRRTAMKIIFYSLPGRWLVYFFWALLVGFPFLDGRRGMRYLWLETYSQFLGSRRNGVREC